MAVVKEFDCLAHGGFDGFSLDDGSVPGCPKGCGPSMVQRVFRTAPAVQSAGYRRMNNTFENLAREHGLSNIQNRSSIQDQTGMRMADYAAHKRLKEATEAVIGPSRAGLSGVDAGSFFKPLGEFQAGSTGDGGALQRVGANEVEMKKGGTFKTGGTLLSGAIPLSTPKPLVEGVHNGAGAGLPKGDA